MDFEKALKVVGEFGRYQKALIPIFGAAMLCASLQLFVQVFAAGRSDHWCRSWKNEDCEELNLTKIECEHLKRELSIPYIVDDKNETIYKQCEKYNVTGISMESELLLKNKEINFEEIPCDDGWIHDQSTFPSTIIIDFELVCGKSHQPIVAQTAYFAGYFVGSLFGGLSADFVGRRRTIIINTALALASGIATVFSPSMWMYILFRLLSGTCMRGVSIAIATLGSELVSPSKRMILLNAMYVFWAVGYFVLAALARLIPNWRFVQFVISLPFLPLLVIFFFFLVESPLWLISKERFSNAEMILQKMAAFNGKEVTEKVLRPAKETAVKKTESSKELLQKLLRSPRVLLISVVMCFEWFVQSILYFGLSLSTSSLGIDPYISFVISGAIEIPGYIVVMFLPDLIGRKVVGLSGLVLGGMACCFTVLFPLGLWRALLAMAGKFCSLISFAVVATWSAELYPTSLRSTAMALFSMSARIGGILVPFILILEDVWISLPLLITGSLSIITGLLCLLLPETRGHPLPSSFYDIETLYGLSVTVDDTNNEDSETNKLNKEIEE